MPTAPDSIGERIRTVTRSGRAVRPPVRYEPDPDETLEDDYSDGDTSDGEWGCGEAAQTDSEQSDFSSIDEPQDGSYESVSDTFSTEGELEAENDDFFVETDSEEFTEDEDGGAHIDPGDILEWDTLTADASDGQSSEDDRDL